jgi:uncharacterized protein DUF2255
MGTLVDRMGRRRSLLMVRWHPYRHPGGGAGIERDVAFEAPDDADHHAIDDAYRTKYARFASTYVEPMVSPAATAATLRLVPRSET